MKMLPAPATSSSTSSSTKIKTLIHTVIASHVRRLARALNKAKTILIRHVCKNNKHYKTKELFFGSFRLHYNWCSSSHVTPVPAPILDECVYYDSTWNSIVSAADIIEPHLEIDSAPSQLSGYLQWLEDKKVHQEIDRVSDEKEKNEIDKLADMFIANCHEKFRLEKVESYRKFQEMLARSV